MKARGGTVLWAGGQEQRRVLIAAAHDAGSCSVAAGDAGCRARQVRPRGRTGVRLEIRSAHRLVDGKTRRAAVIRHGTTRACGRNQ